MISLLGQTDRDPWAATLFTPDGRYDRPINHIVVLQRGPSPTTEIYLRHRLVDTRVPVSYVDMRKPVGNAAALFPDGAFVIIVRYLNSRFAGFLDRFRGRFSGVAYLMDDDIPVGARDPNLPFDYRFMLATYYGRYRRFFARLCSEVWITSEGLEYRYGSERIRRIDPMYLESSREPEHNGHDGIRLFYHATFTHTDDALWLRQVVAPVLEAHSDTAFELFGYRRVAEAFRSVPRCRLLKERSWTGFLDYTSANRLHIGLAPLSDTPFNRGRSFNKIFDITRCGAAGIYADQIPYSRAIVDGETGLLAGRDPDVWRAAILSLIESPDLRRRIHRQALAQCRENNRRCMESPVFARFF